MNCPACDKEVKVLPDKPTIIWDTTVTTMGMDANSQNNTFTVGHASMVHTKEIYKCCNEKCWVTRIKVSWGQA